MLVRAPTTRKIRKDAGEAHRVHAGGRKVGEVDADGGGGAGEQHRGDRVHLGTLEALLEQIGRSRPQQQADHGVREGERGNVEDPRCPVHGDPDERTFDARHDGRPRAIVLVRRGGEVAAGDERTEPADGTGDRDVRTEGSRPGDRHVIQTDHGQRDQRHDQECHRAGAERQRFGRRRTRSETHPQGVPFGSQCSCGIPSSCPRLIERRSIAEPALKSSWRRRAGGVDSTHRRAFKLARSAVTARAEEGVPCQPNSLSRPRPSSSP